MLATKVSAAAVFQRLGGFRPSAFSAPLSICQRRGAKLGQREFLQAARVRHSRTKPMWLTGSPNALAQWFNSIANGAQQAFRKRVCPPRRTSVVRLPANRQRRCNASSGDPSSQPAAETLGQQRV